MLGLIKDLVHHKGFANASLLKAIGMHAEASQDAELRKLLHHIILANRFWFYLISNRPFNIEEESRIPESFEAIVSLYKDMHDQEIEWITRANEDELDRSLESPLIPVSQCSVAQAMMQVCMHSHGHRAQCSTRLRQLGGTPPATDFILWLKNRPMADWT
ncbi:MAG TPA: DinB family protein [Blastocatellia bacterium]|nr:DinB family protein [Blastocatellia bacterium]